MKPTASKLKTIRPSIGERAHYRHKLKIEILFPNMKRGDQKVVNAGYGSRLQKQFGLRTTLFAGDQYFRDGSRLGKGQLAVRLAHKVAPQRNEEENSQATACQTEMKMVCTG